MLVPEGAPEPLFGLVSREAGAELLPAPTCAAAGFWTGPGPNDMLVCRVEFPEELGLLAPEVLVLEALTSRGSELCGVIFGSWSTGRDFGRSLDEEPAGVSGGV